MKQLIVILAFIALLGNNYPISRMWPEQGAIELLTQESQPQIVCVREISSVWDVLASKQRVEIEYDGNIIPPPTYEYSYITSKGKKYKGTLSLSSYIYSPKRNVTTARYTGEIYPAN